MYLWLIVVIPVTLAYVEEYKAFDDCGVRGWSCNKNADGYTVTYRCSSTDRDARVWMWTARIPSSANILAVENCDHVEVHPDCTMGYRSYSMRTFRATNIKHLEILQPLRPSVFLHDNDQVAHMTPELRFENVEKMTGFAGLFDKAGGRCRTKQQNLEVFFAKNVNFTDLMGNEFKGQTLKSFSLQNVSLHSVPNRRFTIAANVSIVNSSFTTSLPPMQITGQKVLFQGNSIRLIAEKTLSIRCNEFFFSSNNVSITAAGAFDVLAREAFITGNQFKKINQNAFAGISPTYGTIQDFESVKRISLEISENIFEEPESLSLHPNYTAYKSICGKFIIKNNHQPCKCPDMVWSPVNVSGDLEEFYSYFTANDSGNTCFNLMAGKNCSTCEEMVYQQNPCEEPTSTTHVPTTIPTTKSPTTTRKETEIPTTAKLETRTTFVNDSRSSIPREEVAKATSRPIFITILSVTMAVLLISAAGVAFYCWFQRKRKYSRASCTVYQNHCRSEYDEETLVDDR